MENIGGFLILVSMVVGAVSFVGLFRRLPSLWLPTRKRAVRVWGAAVGLFFIGGLMPAPPGFLPPPEEQEVVPNTQILPADNPTGAATAAEHPAIVHEPAWTAHAYTVVREEDISSSIRIRRRIWIVAPTAQTPESRIATLMEAAIHVHRQSYPQFLSAFLLPFDTADDAMAMISYAPDGCGVSGSDCTGDMWTDARTSDKRLTADAAAVGKAFLALGDRLNPDTVAEGDERLFRVMAEENDVDIEIVRKAVNQFYSVSFPNKAMELPDDLRTKGELTEEEQTLLADVACRADLQCWGDKHSLRATRPCQLAIEKLALYDYEWTDGWLGVKFDSFAWKDREAGTLAYRGSEITFQNAFGAWQRASYWCDYDPNTQTVLDARVF